MSNNKPFKAKNGIIAKRYLQKAGSVVAGGYENYRLDLLRYTGKSVNFYNQETDPKDIYFSSNGLTMMLGGGGSSGTASVFQYNLSTAYDISTAAYSGNSYDAETNQSPNETDPTAYFWKPDGTAFWMIGLQQKIITQFDLASAWDLSNVSHDANKKLPIGGGTPTNLGSIPRGLFFKPDGSKMYVAESGNTILQFDLTGNEWEVQSATLELTSPPINGTIYHFCISADGTRIYANDLGNDLIREARLSTPWDVSTLENVGFYYMPEPPAGKLAGSTQQLSSIKVNSSGSTLWAVDNETNAAYELSIFQDTKALDLLGGGLFTASPGIDSKITFSNPPSSGSVASFTLELDAEVSTAYNVNMTAPGSDRGFYWNSTGEPRAILFNPDGTQMNILKYNIGVNNDQQIHVYDLSIPFDVSSSSYGAGPGPQYANNSFDYGSGSQYTASDIAWGDNGNKIYINNIVNERIDEFTMTTPYDVTTANPASRSGFFNMGAGYQSFCFKPDGTRMYTVNDSSDAVQEWELSTPWDITTTSFDSSTINLSGDWPGMFGAPQGIRFNSTGTSVFISERGTDWIVKYDCLRPWSTAKAVPSTDELNLVGARYADGNYYYYATEQLDLYALEFNPDGTKMYLPGTNPRMITVVDTSFKEQAMVEWSDNIKWEGGITPSTPEPGKKSTYAFITIDGGSTYYGKEIVGEV